MNRVKARLDMNRPCTDLVADQRMNAIQVDLQYVYIVMVLIDYSRFMNIFDFAPYTKVTCTVRIDLTLIHLNIDDDLGL